ncbi:MAG: PilZ domain-containing protein [Candidatus Omnitrophica bacterium]|nr:PilZ domain-containing protein [Candidatus Omnitrophota bacterium]
MSTTSVILKVGSEETLTVRTRLLQQPPTIMIEFPGQRVVGLLPERTVGGQGVVRAIAARYGSPTGAPPTRFIQSVAITLDAPHPFRVRSEPGQVVVEIDHPVSVGRADVEVGLRGGTVISGLGAVNISERFRAMQHAMAQATPATWVLPLNAAPAASQRLTPSGSVQSTGDGISEVALRSSGSPSASTGPGDSEMTTLSLRREPGAPVSSRPGAWTMKPSGAPPQAARRTPASSWAVGFLGLGLACGAGFWAVFSWKGPGRFVGRALPTGRLPAGVILIDQLVWRAFERQGYQLVLEKELLHTPLGTLRVITKDDVKSALLFVGSGPFFEKQTVEQFINAMRGAEAAQGFLVAAGTFTIPAQRLAKEHRVALVEREQVVELLSAGAGNEHFTRQLEQSRARLEEARAAVRQYTEELEALRRQRNVASWSLGEERAKSAKLETQLSEFSEQLRRYEADIQRWEREADTLRKRWEESQWYLGESQERVRHLETQLAILQDGAKQVETAEQGTTEAARVLDEERAKHEQLAAQLAELQQQLQASTGRERALQEAFAIVKRELGFLEASGNRRRQARVRVPEGSVEVRNGKQGSVMAGSLRDLSSAGVGLETAQELPARPSLRIRITVPGHSPIESRAHVKWQRVQDGSSQYRSGYRLIGLSASTRAQLDQLVETFRSARP